MLGSTLANRYKIEAEIGRGGMGIVYKGYDLLLKRPVAIKILSSASLSPEDRARLLAEAQAAAQLNHPNVVTVYDALEVDNQPFIIMEFVEGKTLRSIPQPTMKESIDYMRQICSALAHAHSKGIIHRDLKPENALLTATGTVKLMDFGLARHIDDPRVTRADTLVGTFAYMAPELIQGKDPSPQSDVYALGLMLYEFVTGGSPFETGNLATLLDQQLHKAAVPPQRVVPGLPDRLNELIVKMVEKKPEDRPSSVQAVEAVLRSFQTDLAITLPALLGQLGIESLDELAKARAPERAKWEQEWRRKSYPKSAVPALDTREKEQILSNRAREIAKSIQHLNEHRLLLITGMPGIGKSTLARTLMEFMPPESPPAFWYDFERHQSSGNTLGILLDRISAYLEKILGNEAREEILSFRNSPEHQASTYDVDVMIDSLNQQTPLWLIFDNFEVILSKDGEHFLDDKLEALFSGLKHNTHNAKIIISSLFVPRLKNGDLLLEYGTRPLTLQGLEENFAVECLRAHGLQDFPDETVIAIARRLDGHPFALSHAAHFVEALGVHALNSLDGGLEEFSQQFKASLQQRLPADEFSILQDLTVLQREISLDGLCRTGETKPATIKHLREKGLLETSDTRKFWLPTIVRDSLRLDNVEAARQAHLRAAQFYREQKRSILPRQIDDFADVLEWHHHAAQAGDVTDAYEAVFSTGLIDQLTQWNEFTLATELCENIHSRVNPQQNLLGHSQWMHLNHRMGILYFLLGKYPQSITHLQSALDSISRDDPITLRAKLLIDLAESIGNQGETARAMQLCEEGVALLQEGLDYAKALCVRGILHRTQGNYDQSITDLEHARTIYESHKQLTSVAYVTGELGIVHYYLNQFTRALENYQRATQACETVKDSRGAMIGHLNIGDVLLQQRQYEAAQHELRTALEIARKKKLTRDELTAGLYLIETEIALGQVEGAKKELESLQPLLDSTESICARGNTMRLRAGLHWLENKSAEAVENFEAALELLKGPECQYELAHAHLDFAPILHHLGRTKEAEQAFAQAKSIFEALNNQLGMEAVLEIQQGYQQG